MLALYRSGRQAEALEVYRDGRRRLANDLGLEPGSELQRLERAILEQDPELDAPTGARAPHGASSEPAPRPWSPPGDGAGPGGRSRGGCHPRVSRRPRRRVGLGDDRPSGPGRGRPGDEPRRRGDPGRLTPSGRLGRCRCGVGGRRPRWHGHADRPRRRARSSRRSGSGRPSSTSRRGLGDLWAATGGSGDVVQIDPELGAVARRIPLGDPDDPFVPSVSAIGVGDGRVWAGTVEGLAQIDPATGAIIRTVDLGERSCSRSPWATAPCGRRRSQAGRYASRRAPRARRPRSTRGTGCTRSLSEAAPSGSAAAPASRRSTRSRRRRCSPHGPRRTCPVSPSAKGRSGSRPTTERALVRLESRDGRGGGAHRAARPGRRPPGGQRARLGGPAAPGLNLGMRVTRCLRVGTLGTTTIPATIFRRSSSTCSTSERGTLRADLAEPDGAVAHPEDRVASGDDATGLHLAQELKEASVVPLEDARQDMWPEERLVAVDADTPDAAAGGRGERSEPTFARDVEDRPGAARDLAAGEGGTLRSVEPVVRVVDQHLDARCGSSSAGGESDDEVPDRAEPSSRPRCRRRPGRGGAARAFRRASRRDTRPRSSGRRRPARFRGGR